MSNRSIGQRLWYRFLQVLCRLAGSLLFSLRAYDSQAIPANGGAMLLSNHQSHLDPILVGAVSRRRMCYLARLTLFRFAPLAWLIRSLGAIPIDREGSGLGGLKQTLKLLKAGEVVLIFPEGTRTQDGTIAELKAGFATIAKRVDLPLVPLAIAGAYEAWPRERGFPLPGRVVVQFGQPISPAEVAAWDEAALVAETGRRIASCYALAKARRAGERSPTAKASGNDGPPRPPL